MAYVVIGGRYGVLDLAEDAVARGCVDVRGLGRAVHYVAAGDADIGGAVGFGARPPRRLW